MKSSIVTIRTSLLRMMYYSVSDTGILRKKKKQEFSQQRSNGLLLSFSSLLTSGAGNDKKILNIKYRTLPCGVSEVVDANS